jgi:hypothetical protein
MGNRGLSFGNREDAVSFARQQEEDGLYPIVYRTKGEYNVIVCESKQEYNAITQKLAGQVGSRR